jgi:hypothetical protein
VNAILRFFKIFSRDKIGYELRAINSYSRDNAQGRRPGKKVAQPEASECEAVGLGKTEKEDEPQRGDTHIQLFNE